jgi:hypothetical protein
MSSPWNDVLNMYTVEEFEEEHKQRVHRYLRGTSRTSNDCSNTAKTKSETVLKLSLFFKEAKNK